MGGVTHIQGRDSPCLGIVLEMHSGVIISQKTPIQYVDSGDGWPQLVSSLWTCCERPRTCCLQTSASLHFPTILGFACIFFAFSPISQVPWVYRLTAYLNKSSKLWSAHFPPFLVDASPAGVAWGTAVGGSFQRVSSFLLSASHPETLCNLVLIRFTHGCCFP